MKVQNLTSNFQFVSPHPIEECVSRLESLRHPWKLFSRQSVSVEIQPISATQIHFKVVKNLGRNNQVQAIGTLTQQPNGATLAEWQTGFPRYMWVMWSIISIVLLLLLPGIVYMVVQDPVLLIFAIVPIVSFFISLFMFRHYRRQLTVMIEEQLK